LWFLPQIDEAFRRGDLSYSKVRALTRTATDATETDLLDFALDATASQVEAYCRRLRNGDAPAAAADARRLQASRSLIRQFREDGSGLLSVELPREELELVLQAIELVGRRLPEDPTRSLFAKGADALVQMARETLAGGHDGTASSDEYQVVVHVDAAALSGKGGESDLPLPTVQRLCCDGAVIPLVENSAGEPLNVGRKQRTIPTAIKRALLARDRHCSWPGCHHECFLESHHIHHWAEGGETSLANLTLLCGTHHKLLHEGGFTIERHRDGRFYFVRPDRRPVEAARDVEREHHVEEPQATYRLSFSAENGWYPSELHRMGLDAWPQTPAKNRTAPFAANTGLHDLSRSGCEARQRRAISAMGTPTSAVCANNDPNSSHPAGSVTGDAESGTTMKFIKMKSVIP
jgi:hypothetical protein